MAETIPPIPAGASKQVPNNEHQPHIESRQGDSVTQNNVQPPVAASNTTTNGGYNGVSQQNQPPPPSTVIGRFGPTNHSDHNVINDTPLCSANEFSPGNFGIYASLLLLVLVMVGSVLILNYGNLVTLPQWTSGCPIGYESACKSVGGVYRFSFALSCVFFLQLLGTLVYTKLFDYLFPFKYLLFVCILIGFFFVPAQVFDLHGFAWFARIAAFLYLVSQQVILLDFAYTWNESWVRWSEEADNEQKQSLWLIGLVAVSVFLFSGSLTVVGIMFWQFQGCPDSTAILSLTIIFCVMVTTFQLFISDDGSLLTSAIMTAYATYICYSAVILNPDTACNPTLSTGYQTISKAVGIGILILSLTWSTRTTIRKIKEARGFETVVTQETAVSINPAIDPTNPSVIPVSEEIANDPYALPGLKMMFVEVSAVFILVTCYFAMVLTNWATVQSRYGLATANSGTAAMWLQASGQWVALAMYAWSLVAPKLFPDRDFGGGRDHTNNRVSHEQSQV